MNSLPPLESSNSIKNVPRAISESSNDNNVLFATHDFTPKVEKEICLIAGEQYVIEGDDVKREHEENDDKTSQKDFTSDLWIRVSDFLTRKKVGMAPRKFLVRWSSPKRLPYYFNYLSKSEAIKYLLRASHLGSFAYLMVKSMNKDEFSLLVRNNSDVKAFNAKFLRENMKYLVDFSKVQVLCEEPYDFIETVLEEEMAMSYLARDAPKLPGLGFYFDPCDLDIRNIPNKTYINGGMFGTVYKANGPFGANIAVKYFKKNESENADEFNREILKKMKSLTCLYHPCFLPVIACDIVNNGEIAIVMPFMPMGSLAKLLAKEKTQVMAGGEVNKEKLFRYLVDICRAMEYLHKKGVLFCDLTVRNVMMSEDGECKLSDLYHAKILRENCDFVEYIPGTPIRVRGLSPEAIERKTFSRALDVWQFGLFSTEVFSFGDQVYPEFESTSEGSMKLAQHILEGNLPEKPFHMPFEIHQLTLTRCFQHDPLNRSNFYLIKKKLLSL